MSLSLLVGTTVALNLIIFSIILCLTHIDDKFPKIEIEANSVDPARTLIRVYTVCFTNQNF